MTKEFRVGLIGFGFVGKGFVQVLRNRLHWIQEQYATKILLVGISTRSKGCIYSEQGLNLADVGAWPGNRPLFQSYEQNWDSDQFLHNANLNAVVEVSPTDLSNPQVAYQHCITALNRGIHVLSANKGPVARHYSELKGLAAEKGLHLGFEATVMAGTPCVQVLETLKANGVKKILGVMNGTCNFILDQMGLGQPFDQALAEAQKRGYAEPDPSADIDGLDTLAKALILYRIAFDRDLESDKAQCKGIRNYPMVQVQQAKQLGSRIKLIADIRPEGVRILPQAFDINHPLSQISGATNGILVETEDLGSVYLQGPGAGPKETGSALIQDLVRIL
ncbi:MAG: homoserine dehydrogenase [Acidobacteria bacterium]|nr:homoserine dehydrogenase [Acidobacteriota bacterium]MCB9396189.1 homoserine dehydrogenase [Acidobacteriota bacterium]